MHVHHLQEEALTVETGIVGYQVFGEEARYASEAEIVVFEPGDVHRFWNAGEDVLRCTGYVRPAHNFEYFLSSMYASMKENGGERQKPLDAAYLMTRYRSEFEMPEIPSSVQRFVFPIQLLVGRLSGRLEKFEGVPEPVTKRKL